MKTLSPGYPVSADFTVYPFTAIVGQEEMKRALLLHAVDPTLGGALLFGERGTGKSTAVRALSRLLPPIIVVTDCPFHCDPDRPDRQCDACRRAPAGTLKRRRVPTPMVDLPLSATEDRILGSLDLEAALARGEKRFQPGLLAEANRGFLYIDEVNLLPDHLVDLLLDAAASGENIVERDGFSIRHPAQFVLVGSGNPEEGELRPQLLDRFALSATVSTLTNLEERARVLRRRLEFTDSPGAFWSRWQEEETKLARRITRARELLPHVEVTDAILEIAAAIGAAAEADGHRAELALVRAARAEAALAGRRQVEVADVRRTAAAALAHRCPHGQPEAIAEIVAEVVGRYAPLDR